LLYHNTMEHSAEYKVNSTEYKDALRRIHYEGIHHQLAFTLVSYGGVAGTLPQDYNAFRNRFFCAGS